MARAKESIPSTPAELDAEWVTRAMRGAGVLAADVAVAAIVAGPLDEAGEGMTGDLVRVRLTYDGPTEAPPTLVAKFATDDRQTRGMLESVIDAGLRTLAVQEALSVRVLSAAYGEAGALHDLWMPRVLAALAHRRGR